jgi:sporulation protein YlmC with PRC-barrel domain
MITQQELENLTGLIARKAAIHFRTSDQDAIEVTQDLVKAILKDYIIIKRKNDEIYETKSY